MVFSIVPKAHAIADIGTDHGYLAVELINRNRAEFVIAGDVHKGPLESAKEYVQSCGLTSKVDCRLGDGLKVTEKGELNGAICCGMGGYLMRDIVDAGPEPLEFYVLQPQNGQKNYVNIWYKRAMLSSLKSSLKMQESYTLHF